MQLSEQEIELFYSLYYPLLVYVNQKLGVIPGLYASEDISKVTLEEFNELRQQLYNNAYLFDLFVEENPLKLSADKTEIVASWKAFIKGKFYIFSYLEEFTIFISDRQPNKAYGVLALDTPFLELVGSSLPVMTETVLLPFKQKIIYDGTLQSYPFFFGRSIRGSLNDTYKKAIERFGIITSLESGQDEEDDEAPSNLSDKDLLKFYLKNPYNREKYWNEINELMENNESLKLLYHQELGKKYAEEYSDRLREIGLKKAWFAIFEEMPIASGSTKAEVEGILKKILPADKRKFVYVFRLKTK